MVASAWFILVPLILVASCMVEEVLLIMVELVELVVAETHIPMEQMDWVVAVAVAVYIKLSAVTVAPVF
jgi:hypothetical protein